MTTRKLLSTAAAAMGRAGRGAAKRRGDAAYYRRLRALREPLVPVRELRAFLRRLRKDARHAEAARAALVVLRGRRRGLKLDEARALCPVAFRLERGRLTAVRVQS